MPHGHDIGRGIGFAVLGFALFSASDVFVKWLANDGYSVVQLSATFAVFALVPLAWLVRRAGGWPTLKARNPFWVGLRAVLLAVDTLFAYYAFGALPFAEAYAIFFGTPMLVTALSVPLLGEKVGIRRWSAVIVGFLGVLVMTRPGSGVFEVAALVPLLGAVFYALAMISIRRLAQTEPPTTIVFYFTLFAVIASLFSSVRKCSSTVFRMVRRRSKRAGVSEAFMFRSRTLKPREAGSAPRLNGPYAVER